MRREHWIWGAIAGFALSGCSDSTKSAPLEIPPFMVVGDSGGVSHLYRVQDSVEMQLSGRRLERFRPAERGWADRLHFQPRWELRSLYRGHFSDSMTPSYEQYSGRCTSCTQSRRFHDRVREQS